MTKLSPRTLIILLSVVVLLAGAGAIAIAGRTENAPPDNSPVQMVGKGLVKITDAARPNLQITSVKLQDYKDQIDIMGKISVTENGTTMIASRAAGRIDSITVSSGEAVTQGQLLARIYSPDFAGAREEYLQAGLRARSEGGSDFKTLSTMSYKKLQSLGLSKSDIADLGKSDPNLLAVHAPNAGIIIDKKIVLGSAVNAGDELFTLGDLHKVWFLGDLYPEELAHVQVGQDVLIDPVVAGKPLSGKVSFISPVIDPSSRTVKIRVLMDNPDQALRADMYVQAHLVLSTRPSLMVPTSALFNEAGKNYLFRQQPGSTDVFEKIPVESGNQSQGETVITSGLKEGDSVVTSGGFLLNAVLENAGTE